MKVSPRADYPVRVRPHSWEADESVADLYTGIYDVTLNHSVTVAFVPDMSSFAPPFDDALLPRDLDDITTPAQARLAATLFNRYVVTPNVDRAGTQEHFPSAYDDPGSTTGVVFYLSPQQFADYTAELDDLISRLGALHPPETVSDLADSPVIQFIRRMVLRPPVLRPDDAAILMIQT